jgi:hypothetical protein
MDKIPISVLVIILSQLSSIGFGIFPRKTIKNFENIQTHSKL